MYECGGHLNMKFNTKITSRALFTIVGGAVLINPVFAQEQASEELDEVVVTGLRGSLKASMETKRDALGVVDAINAAVTGGNGGNSRSFNFANLSAEAINAVEVYKTGRADNATGGIGATINIRTA